MFSDKEIRELARDRTALSRTLGLGGSQQIFEWLQLGFDVNASNLGGTPASGGVDGTDGSAWELSYYPQFIASNLMTNGDVTTLGYRYFAGRPQYALAD